MNHSEQRIPSFFSHPFTLSIIGVICFGALLSLHRELAVLACLVGGLMGATRLWSRFAPNRVSCELSVDRCRVFPGEVVVLKAVVKNNKLLPVHFTLSLAGSDVIAPMSQQPSMEQSGALLWFHRSHFSWDFTALRRGVHSLGPPKLTAGDMLGYYTRETDTKTSILIIVFPRLVHLNPARFSRQDIFGKAGNPGMLPDPLYVIGTRDYQACHPARHIHWKASARLRRIQEKVYEPSFQEKLLFIVPVDGFVANHEEAAFERTLEVVASLSVRIQGGGHPVGLATNASCEACEACAAGLGERSVFLPPAGNPKQLSALMETLARMRMESSGNIVSFIQSRAPLPWGMSSLVFSLENDDKTASLLRSLKRRRIPTALVLCGGRAAETQSVEEQDIRIYSLTEFIDTSGESS
jgi:uncharacterized protein (DUF58 family)